MALRVESGEHLVASLKSIDLDDRRKSLELRLEDGFQRIEQASLAGSDVREWESFWIRLLGEYESVCRDLEEAA